MWANDFTMFESEATTRTLKSAQAKLFSLSPSISLSNNISLIHTHKKTPKIDWKSHNFETMFRKTHKKDETLFVASIQGGYTKSLKTIIICEIWNLCVCVLRATFWTVSSRTTATARVGPTLVWAALAAVRAVRGCPLPARPVCGSLPPRTIRYRRHIYPLPPFIIYFLFLMNHDQVRVSLFIFFFFK